MSTDRATLSWRLHRHQRTELAAFIGEYDIGDLLSYRGIAEGVENSNFMLHTSGGSFILTLYEKRVNPDDLPFFLGLMDHLHRAEFPARCRFIGMTAR